MGSTKIAAVGLGTAALATIAAATLRRVIREAPETGMFANGMEYAHWGQGPKTVLLIPGGPGSDVPRGAFGALAGWQFRALLDSGYSVWHVTRRRGMPDGHTVADMADDYAALIRDSFGGHVDVVVGVSYGGLILQHLEADHPETLGRAVIAMSAGHVSDWGHDVDRRWAQARAAGRLREAGEAMAEYIYPEPQHWRRRRVLGPVMALTFKDEQVPVGDLKVESDAEVLFDAAGVLPRIAVPTLLISAEEDLFFSPEEVERTVAAIPGCETIQYPGMGHLRASMSAQLARDVRDFAAS